MNARFATLYQDTVNSIIYRLWCVVGLIDVIAYLNQPEMNGLMYVCIFLQIVAIGAIVGRSLWLWHGGTIWESTRAERIVSNVLALPATSLMCGLIMAMQQGFERTPLLFICLGSVMGIGELVSELIPERSQQKIKP